MKWDERDDSNTILFAAMAGDAETVERFRPLVKMGPANPFSGSRRHGSQNYDVSARAALGDKDWFRRLEKGYRIYGLHWKEWGPIYLPHHIMAWEWMRHEHGLEEAVPVLRATYYLLSMLASPLTPEIIRLDPPRIGRQEWRLNGWTEGVWVLPVGERTGHDLRDTLLNWILDRKAGKPTGPSRERPRPVARPKDGRILVASGGSVMQDGFSWGKYCQYAPDKMWSWDAGVDLQQIIDGDLAACREGSEVMSYPYAGKLVGLVGKDFKLGISAVQLNSNKPPVEYARADYDLPSLLCRASVFRLGQVKGVRARGAEKVAIRYTSDDRHRVLIWEKDEEGEPFTCPFPVERARLRWDWGQVGFRITDLGSENQLVATPPSPQQEERKKGWVRKLIDFAASLFS